MTVRSSGSNLRLVLTIAFAIGVMSFEQGSVGYLLPFLQPSLALTNTQIGLVASIYWAMFAIGSYGTGVFAGTRGHIRDPLTTVLAIFGACSFLSGLVGGFGSLLFARAVMGVLAGALLTLAQALLALNSSPEKLGANMGLATGLGGSLSGLVIAPIVLVQVASSFGWRSGYFIIAVPAWLAAYRVWRNSALAADALMGGPPTPRRFRDAIHGTIAVLRERNIMLCGLLCSLYIAYVGLGMTFLPRFLVATRGFSPTQMSTLIAVLGASSLIFSIILPALSDWLGRKRVLLAACAAGVLVPAAACFFHGAAFVLGCLLFLGWSMAGTGSFFMGIIPSETVDASKVSGALGSVLSLGVLFGGLFGPSIAGWSADRWGSAAPLAVQAICSILAVLAVVALRETKRDRAASGVGPISPKASLAPTSNNEPASELLR